jgi:hypothetical protein
MRCRLTHVASVDRCHRATVTLPSIRLVTAGLTSAPHATPRRRSDNAMIGNGIAAAFDGSRFPFRCAGCLPYRASSVCCGLNRRRIASRASRERSSPALSSWPGRVTRRAFGPRLSATRPCSISRSMPLEALRLRRFLATAPEGAPARADGLPRRKRKRILSWQRPPALLAHRQLSFRFVAVLHLKWFDWPAPMPHRPIASPKASASPHSTATASATFTSGSSSKPPTP